MSAMNSIRTRLGSRWAETIRYAISTPIMANTTPCSTVYGTTRCAAVGTVEGFVTPSKVAAPSSAGVRNGRPLAAS